MFIYNHHHRHCSWLPISARAGKNLQCKRLSMIQFDIVEHSTPWICIVVVVLSIRFYTRHYFVVAVRQHWLTPLSTSALATHQVPSLSKSSRQDDKKYNKAQRNQNPTLTYVWLDIEFCYVPTFSLAFPYLSSHCFSHTLSLSPSSCHWLRLNLYWIIILSETPIHPTYIDE